MSFPLWKCCTRGCRYAPIEIMDVSREQGRLATRIRTPFLFSAGGLPIHVVTGIRDDTGRAAVPAGRWGVSFVSSCEEDGMR